MAWLSSSEGIVIQKDVSKGCISQQRIDFDSPPDAYPKYNIHATVYFFGTTTRTVTEYRGLTRAAAVAMVNASGATYSNFEEASKNVVGDFYAFMPYEKSTKTTSMRRADDSGQYIVTVTETTTEVS